MRFVIYGRTGGVVLRAIVLTLVGVFLPQATFAVSQSDIVWPTYSRSERSDDALLNCTQLQGEIAHVASDIRLLHKAQARAEDALHSAFDMERYGGSTGLGGQRFDPGIVEGKESYAAARGNIVASLRVATARREHLKSLEPACKTAR